MKRWYEIHTSPLCFPYDPSSHLFPGNKGRCIETWFSPLHNAKPCKIKEAQSLAKVPLSLPREARLTGRRRSDDRGAYDMRLILSLSTS